MNLIRLSIARPIAIIADRDTLLVREGAEAEKPGGSTAALDALFCR